MQHDPQAEVLVVPAAQARLDATRLLLPGGGSAEVFEDEDGDQLVQVEGGRVLPDELLRATVTAAGFSARARVLDLVVVTDTGWDRHVLTDRLDHRLLHARHDAAAARSGGRDVVVVGPPRRDPLSAAAPSRCALAVARLVAAGSRPVVRCTELSLPPDPVLAAAGGRREAVLAEADVVVAAWGVLDGEEHEHVLDDTRAALRGVRDRGGAVLVRTRAGRPDAVGRDGHPAARQDVRHDDGLAAAPADWLWGAPLG